MSWDCGLGDDRGWQGGVPFLVIGWCFRGRCYGDVRESLGEWTGGVKMCKLLLQCDWEDMSAMAVRSRMTRGPSLSVIRGEVTTPVSLTGLVAG